MNHFETFALKLNMPLSLATLLALSIGTSASHAQNYVPGDVIVKLRGKMSSRGSQDFQQKAQGERGLHLKGSFSALNLHHYASQDRTRSVKSLMDELKQDPNVEYVEPNYIIRKTDLSQQSVETYTLSEVASSTASTSATSFSQTTAPIQATNAWPQLTPNLATPIVAIIDTGVQITHPALANAIWTNPNEFPSNGIDDDGNGYVDDVHGWNFSSNSNDPSDCDGHGTHVAGIVRGVGQNILQSPSPSPLIQIMAIRFMDCTGAGSTTDAIKAIYYAVNSGAHILNNSWGGPDYSRALHEAIAYAYQHQALFVAAAGNSNSNNDTVPSFPASLDVPSLISVAATTNADGLAIFSNFGSTSVHVAAPGVSVLSTYIGDSYASLSGTSMATPFISGTAALMLRERSQLNGYQLKTLLLGAVDPINSLAAKVSSQGRLNILNSVVASKTASVPSGQPAYSVQSSMYDRLPASSVSKSSGGGGCGLVQRYSDESFGHDETGRGGATPLALYIGLAICLLFPLGVALMLRVHAKYFTDNRKTSRIQTDSEIQLKVGGRTILANLRDISLGGAQVMTQEQLSQGTVMAMKINNPDDHREVTLYGRVVWSHKANSYGIQFYEAGSALQTLLKRMQGLQKGVVG